MSAVVADTHAVLWYLAADPKLSLPDIEAMEKAEKNRIQPQALMRLRQALREPGSAFETVPLTAEIAFVPGGISRSSVPDLPDRVIAATALAIGLPLVTRDGKIGASGIETIW